MKRLCRRSNLILLAVFAVFSVQLSACTSETDEEPLVILQNEETELDVAGNVPVEYSDIVSTARISCKYQTAAVQELSFDVERVKITSVHVAAGEEVKAGQLLISVESNNDIDDQIEDLMYEIERLQLEKEKLLNQIEYEKTLAEFNIAMSGLGNDEMRKATEEMLEEIDDFYKPDLQMFDDDISLKYLKITFLENSIVDHNLYAGMDGIVEYVREGLEGSQTVIGKTVIKLKDPGDMYFYTSDKEAFEYLTEGEDVVITVTSTSYAGDYDAVPEITPDGSSIRFILTGEGAYLSMAEGTNGYITVELGRKENCLSIPNRAIHTAGDITYVYVVDGSGYRHYREIKTGLRGDERTEIVSGLEAGDMVAVSFNE